MTCSFRMLDPVRRRDSSASHCPRALPVRRLPLDPRLAGARVESSTSNGHIPGASFLDVDDDLSAPPGAARPAPAARSRRLLRRRFRALGSVTACSSSRTGRWAAPSGSGGSCGTSGTTTAPCSTSTAGSARSRAGEEEIEPRHLRSEPVRRHDRGGRALLPASTSSSSSTPASPSATAASRTRSTRCPAASRAQSTPRGTSRCPSYRTGELVAYCGSGVTSSVTVHRLALAGPRREALPRLVERVGAAPRPPGRARLGGRAFEVGQILAPAVRDLRRGEADEEHRLRRPRRPLELHRRLLEQAVPLLQVARRT